MTYFVSDIHGEYELFLRLLDKIKFSDSDKLIVLGDMIDKGSDSIRVLKAIYSLDNASCILGNHEYDFLKYYRAQTENAAGDPDSLLKKLQGYFPREREAITWELLDFVDALPSYIASEDYIGVHAGVPLNKDGTIKPLSEASTEQLVYDRTFKNPETVVRDPRTVLYGHTPTCYINGAGGIIAYPRENGSGYSRVHLDTGVYLTGTLGCFCLGTGKCFYVNK